MAKKPNKSLSVLSTALTGATLVVDFYNSYIYRSKNRKLSYISVGLGLVDVVLSFYLSLGSKSKFTKAWSFFSASRQVWIGIQKIQAIRTRS
ncbi:hypothetical protein MUA33_12070 [Staphylococcus delphini]|uniref:hypothetical protein n=1 Tax=Staphylococcus delphini TaxID=53344 RepID=UPI0021CEFF3F|nr:hypothetical protein [Staphylococcus delphini]UXS29166.1 hypothetical protein MUA33_12070 [Staphylococcus delphini]